jgi:WD40-like Beta Propeller Repeat
VDDPESPAIAPDGRHIAFSALRGAIGDIFMLDLDTGKIENLTNDAFADYGPTFSPDGSYIVYMARVSGNEKLFRLDLDTKKKTQLTYGTHDDAQAKFVDDHTLVFPSTAVNPTLPIEPEVAKNGNIFNIWTLDLKTGELRQFTDAVGGNVNPIVLQGERTKSIAFVTYFKGEWGVHALDRKDPLQTALLSDFGEPGQGPPVDFQPPLTHTLVKENDRVKGSFEKMFLDGRPPVNVGVTSGGNIYGGTAITFSDVLGDKEFNFYFASISQYRTIAGSYVNLSRRLQYAIQGFSQTDFFYGQLGNVFYDPALSGFIDRDLAIATRTAQGGSVYAIYPFNRYRRIEMQAGVVNFKEQFEDPTLEQYSKDYQTQVYGAPLFNDGTAVPFSLAYVQETTVFREFGPVSGNTMRFEYEVAPKIGNTLERQTLDLDARYYLRLGGSGLLALRARGYRSWGDAPNFNYFGGNADLRGYEYLQFVGNNTFYGNAELRFPLVEAMLTPIGVVGGIRGVFFAGTSGAWFNGQGFQFASSKSQTVIPIIGYQPDASGNLVPIFGNPIDVTGYRLVDGRASYGFGLETFALGFPIHFDWAWRTLWNRDWEDYVFAAQGGSQEFRRPQFKVWIGYDF